MEFTQHEKLISTFWGEPDYRDFLRKICENKISPIPFNRAKIARVLDISPSFVTKVFSKKGHLSTEQVLVLCDRFKFEEDMTCAFIDKLAFARADSAPLKKLLARRIQSLFNSSFNYKKPEEPKLPTNKLLPSPGRLIHYKLASILKNGPHTINQLADRLKINPARIEIILKDMKSYFDVQTIEEKGQSKYFLSLESYQYSPGAPGSQNLFELGMNLRRLATYSMEMRHPIHIVDNEEHHVSGTYLVPLDEEQIRILSVLFSQLTRKITDMNMQLKPSPNSKFVGICFDLFDV